MSAALSAAAQHIGATVHGSSIVERAAQGDRGPANTTVLIGADGALLRSHRKIHRFGFGEGEPKLLDAGEEIVTAEVRDTNTTGTAVLGLATCYDLRFPEMFRRLLDAGSEIFLVPAAWPAPRVEHWRLLGRARAVENQCFSVQCNTAGTHSRTEMGGHSRNVDPTGMVLAEGGSKEECLIADLHLDELVAYRRNFSVLADRRIH
ncbi:nitrilase-related carbon-nitrogen hydrolase [Streptomyces sp. DSM 41524]|uniref:Nitrilase-related carbon-nitrogen hydrolase n=1 Tax=Streptomyces asiaticus subsp. ignotus TaxID=3098222 RepID=A0ABU7QBX2_9ACTN|nr:nitrilase-related carbon-nitrogen hydrolase [Streptomyces sp. DSM 41524]